MGRWVWCWACALGLSGLAAGCVSFTQEPVVAETDSDSESATTSTGGTANGGADGGTTVADGGGATMTSPTSTPPSTSPPQTTTGTTGSDTRDDTTGGDNVDPSRAASSGSDNESGGETGDRPATDSSEDPTSGGREMNDCETIALSEQILECSTSFQDDALLTLTNNCVSATVDVYWIDYDCDEVYLGSLNAGQGTLLDTFATHPFRIRNSATGAVLADIDPLAPGAQSIDVL